MIKPAGIVIVCLVIGMGCMGQNGQGIFLLKDIILIAQQRSPKYKLAQTLLEVKEYQFLSFKSDLKPQAFVYGNAPSFSKQYISVTQPDGSIQFQPVQQNINNVGLSLSQVLPFSGGQISLNTELNQFYDFLSKENLYNGTPIFLRLNQPVFGFNEYRWKKKIEPLKVEESRREYIQEMENIAQQAVKLYFDVLDAQSNIEIARINSSNAGLNYDVEKKRVALGTTTEDKLLQLELQMLKSRQDLEKAKYDFKIAGLSLRTFSGDKENVDFRLTLPEELPVLNISLEKAIQYARSFRSEFIAFERKKKEAQRDVAQAKAEKQQINLTASYGLNRASDQLSYIYSDPKSQQTFSIGFNVPVLDWGRRSARYNTAKAMERLVDFNNEMDEASIIQEITTLVSNIDLLKSNIELAKTTDSVAERRYSITENLFRVGKLTVTDLNVAQVERDNAKRSYISALRDFWNSYYLLRRLTLFDFEGQYPLFKQR